ncbi:polysaccharide pyruvyl transferase CsaB [Kamptonema formosum]|uniref:polysaccharide pyruvyl transferase CsaB n=1 Tax=Kamptonema formosum TaxID=331992 RepID=UPI00035C3150|nr:polysaccharide pyruvyl transferase CsaB [Oscillatoria sp. PCC 10802]
MGRMRAVLCGYYGLGNGGDEALLASLLQMLPDRVTPVVLSGNPALTRRRYGVAAVPRMNAMPVLRALRQSDAFIWGGGSLIQDATSALSPFYYAGLMGLAQQLGLKTIAWAQGAGPLKRSFTREIARRTFAGCTAVSVRDRASAALLSDWQIPCYFAPDPVWALEAKPVPGLWDLPAPRVAVTLRKHPQLTPARLETLTRALSDFQKATDTFILLLPFQASQDLEIAEYIHSQLAGASKILSLEDPRELKGVFRGVEMAVGMRLHALIMAAAEECRCFALSYDPKVSQLMAELEMPGWELPQLPDDAKIITKTWLEHYANGEALSPAQLQSIADRSLIHRELLREVFE